MYESLHRLALAVVFGVGIATLVALNQATGHSVADQHRQVMLALIAAALMLAPWLRAVRLPAIAAALASKVALLALFWSEGGATALVSSPGEVVQLLGLAAAGVVLLLEARIEARWDGVLPLRQEG
jgi:hypothetical protein